MSNVTLFAIEVALSVTLSLAVIALLRGPLRRVLTDACGAPDRAEFWLSFTQLMLVLAPLLLVVFFADARPGAPCYPAEAIKDTLFRALLGIFVAIATIGRVMWKAVDAAPASHAGRIIDARTVEAD